MAKSKDRDEAAELESLEDIFAQESAGDEEPGASDDFKALFDELDEDGAVPEEWDEDEAYLAGDAIASEDLENLLAQSDAELDADDNDELLELELKEEEESVPGEEFDEELDNLLASRTSSETESSESFWFDEEEEEPSDDPAAERKGQPTPSLAGKSLQQAFAELTEAAEDDRQYLASLSEAEDDEDSDEGSTPSLSLSEGTELGDFEEIEIEEQEFLSTEQVISIVESLLFSTDKPIGIAYIKRAFEGTRVKTDDIRKAIAQLEIEYASASRGVSLEEVSGGYQLRTKIDNLDYLRRIQKGKPFKLSGPALEVLSIVAYKQPLVKAEIDEIRGVESGHLMRALMDRSLIRFAGKSELPGKPMLYETTKKFLEIFGLRSLKELPSLSEIDELIPEGIGEEENKPILGDVTETMAMEAEAIYSAGEEELLKIEDTLEKIDTSTEFFEQEKAREKARREKERADAIREALEFGEEVEDKDKKWLARYDKRLEEEAAAQAAALTNALVPEMSAGTDLSTEIVDKPQSEDESSELFSDFAPNDLESSSEEITFEAQAGAETEFEADTNTVELEASEEHGQATDFSASDAKTRALSSAFGNIQNALEAFEASDDGIEIDAEPDHYDQAVTSEAAAAEESPSISDAAEPKS